MTTTSPAVSYTHLDVYKRQDLDTLQKYFGFTVSNSKGKPTNSEFIAMIADRLVLQRRQG